MAERWNEDEFHKLFMERANELIKQRNTNKQSMTQKEALELSVQKWQMIVDNEGIYSLGIQRKFAQFQNSCPLCHLYYGSGDCEGCPINLGKTDCTCEAPEHPFFKWSESLNGEWKANAQELLDLIKSKL